MAKVPKNYRLDPEVLEMLEQIVEVQSEMLPVKFNQTTMLEFMIRSEYLNLGLDRQKLEKKKIN